jgi:hypothetical protein
MLYVTREPEVDDFIRASKAKPQVQQVTRILKDEFDNAAYSQMECQPV